MNELPSDIPPPSRPRHEWLVALGLAVVAAGVLFTALDGPRMEPDESLYALATDRLRATGEWLTLYPHPPAPYFNKPPLYMWLSALTYDRVPGFERKYRLWSALFGAAAVAMTGALGTRLFRPAVGLVAGLLLLTNRSFLLDHGARFGGMDAALAACSVTILWLYWVGRTRAGTLWPWASIGLLAGAASLFKPLAGLPMLAVIGLHAVLCRRSMHWVWSFESRLSLAGSAGEAGQSSGQLLPNPDDRAPVPPSAPSRREPAQGERPPARVHPVLAVAVALIVAGAVAGPWYWINHQRFPDAFSAQLFGQQLADSVSGSAPDDETQPWYFYLHMVPASSTLWALVAPAAVWLLVTVARGGGRRPALLLLLAAGLGWVAAFSVPQKKFLHYAYPAFPALAVAMAACLANVLALAAARAGRSRPSAGADRFVSGGLRAAVTGLIAFAGYLALVALPRDGSPLPTWTVYKTFEPAIRDGRAGLLTWGVPHRPDAWPDERLVRPNHMIYLSHMAGVQVVRDPADLAARLSAGRPMLLILSRDGDLTSLPALHPAGHRVDERFTVEQRPYSALAIDVDPLFAPTLRADRRSPYLRFVAATHATPTTSPSVPTLAGGTPFRFAGGEFDLEVSLPLPEPARLTLLIKSADGQPRRRVRCVVHGSKSEPVDLQPMDFFGTHRVAVGLDDREGSHAGRRVVRVTLVPVDGGSTVIAGELIEAVMQVTPRWAEWSE